MTSLSSHVLDAGAGVPAAGVRVRLERLEEGAWLEVSSRTTDREGRVPDLGTDLEAGTYRLVFATGAAGNAFFPEVHVVVALDGTEPHYHIPLLLSPYGYTTYRGS